MLLRGDFNITDRNWRSVFIDGLVSNNRRRRMNIIRELIWERDNTLTVYGLSHDDLSLEGVLLRSVRSVRRDWRSVRDLWLQVSARF